MPGEAFGRKKKRKEIRAAQGGAATAKTFEGYREVALLRRGGSSVVYTATDSSSGNRVAIKLIPSEAAKNRATVRKFVCEAKLLKCLDHPNIINVHDYVKCSQPYMVMEFVESENLKTLISNNDNIIREWAGKIILETASALECIHKQGVIHRDIKPENILVSSDGGVKLIDFTIALTKWQRRFPLGKRNVEGTHAYMSPEQIRNERLDERSDIYSFGATVYELLTRKAPFTGSNKNAILSAHLRTAPVSMRKECSWISSELDKMVLHMLAKKPEDRFQNMSAILARLPNVAVFS